MTNVEKLTRLGMLGGIRQRLGANDENDSSFDDKINTLSNYKIMTEWCAWEIGDGYWWENMYYNFTCLEGLDEGIDEE